MDHLGSGAFSAVPAAASPALGQMRAQVPEVIAATERLVLCESPSHDLSAVRASASVVAQVGTELLGVEPELVEVEGRTHVRWRFGQQPSRVLVLGHHDTVWPMGTLQSIPFQTGTHLRGPGCLDMKAGLALAFRAIANLDDKAGICVLVTGDEELGSVTSRQLIEAEAADATAALVFEAGADSGALKSARKGRAHLRLLLCGRAAHAGLEPEKGANALVALGNVVRALVDLNALTLGTTVTPTVASAGTSANTVADRAEVEVDVRALLASELERVVEAARALDTEVPGVDVELVGGADRPPLAEAMSAELLSRAQRLAQSLGLGEVRGETVGGGSDGNLTAALGVPTLDGLGAVGGGAHARDEFVDVALLAPRLALATALLADLTGSAVRA